jgi:hypothetical protein
VISENGTTWEWTGMCFVLSVFARRPHPHQVSPSFAIRNNDILKVSTYFKDFFIFYFLTDA